MEDFEAWRHIIHYGLHLILPVGCALILFPKQWLRASLIMLAMNLVDLDHLLANPVFDPERCSIGFHVLHSYPAIAIYIIFLFLPRLRIMGIGLLLHMATDCLDCLWIWEFIP